MCAGLGFPSLDPGQSPRNKKARPSPPGRSPARAAPRATPRTPPPPSIGCSASSSSFPSPSTRLGLRLHVTRGGTAAWPERAI